VGEIFDFLVGRVTMAQLISTFWGGRQSIGSSYPKGKFSTRHNRRLPVALGA
jgi:hypothetical protein